MALASLAALLGVGLFALGCGTTEPAGERPLASGGATSGGATQPEAAAGGGGNALGGGDAKAGGPAPWQPE